MMSFKCLRNCPRLSIGVLRAAGSPHPQSSDYGGGVFTIDSGQDALFDPQRHLQR